MKFQIDYSPLASWRSHDLYRMPTNEAQTLYPSLRGQCRMKLICRFTMNDIRQQPYSKAKIERN